MNVSVNLNASVHENKDSMDTIGRMVERSGHTSDGNRLSIDNYK